MDWRKKLSGAEFFSALNLDKGSVVSLVGAGGKTTMMFTLAKLGKSLGLRVLVTTSTRILIPQTADYDYINLSGIPHCVGDQPCICVFGQKCESSHKMQGLDENLLADIIVDFDLVLIEADGSNCKPLKGWKETEPVVPFCTTHTLGIFDLSVVHQKINESVVHRLPLFLELTAMETGNSLQPLHVGRIVNGKRGLFQYAVGERILFLNKLETIDSQRLVEEIECFVQVKTLTGSLHEAIYYA